MIKSKLLVLVWGVICCYGFDERFMVALSDIKQESVAAETEIEYGVIPDWLDGRLYHGI